MNATKRRWLYFIGAAAIVNIVILMLTISAPTVPAQAAPNLQPGTPYWVIYQSGNGNQTVNPNDNDDESYSTECTLRDALDYSVHFALNGNITPEDTWGCAAAAVGSNPTNVYLIQLPAGYTYTLWSQLGKLYEDVPPGIELWIVGAGSSVVQADGAAFSADYRVFQFSNSSVIAEGPGGYARPVRAGSSLPDVYMEDMTIQNGYSYNGGWGMGVYASDVDLFLNNVTVQDNVTGCGDGAGVFIDSANGDAVLEVVNSRFFRNEAYYCEGGGNGGGLATGNINSATINGSQFDDNHAQFDGGGAYFTSYTGSVNLTSTSFDGNDAGSNGGAVYNGSSMTVQGCTFTGNGYGEVELRPAPGATERALAQIGIVTYQGGAIYNDNYLSISGSTIDGNGADEGGGIFNYDLLYMTTSTVRNNVASYGGGGLLNFDDAIAEIYTSTFNNNESLYGGGIYSSSYGLGKNVARSGYARPVAQGPVSSYCQSAGGTCLYLENDTISGNTATQDGGGVYNGDYFGATHVTIAYNNAASGDTGGGLFNDGAADDATLYATLLAYNQNEDCYDGAGTLTDAGFTLDSDGTCKVNDPALSGVDPNLDTLQNFGGPTQTHAFLLGGSIAIDYITDPCVVSIDQRGTARPQDGDNAGASLCDIGAFESIFKKGPVIPPPVTIEVSPGGVSDTPTPTFTPTPTATETETIIVFPPPILVETATPTATAVPPEETPEETPEVTPEPTEEATPEPTEEVAQVTEEPTVEPTEEPGPQIAGCIIVDPERMPDDIRAAFEEMARSNELTFYIICDQPPTEVILPLIESGQISTDDLNRIRLLDCDNQGNCQSYKIQDLVNGDLVFEAQAGRQPQCDEGCSFALLPRSRLPGWLIPLIIILIILGLLLWGLFVILSRRREDEEEIKSKDDDLTSG